MLCKIIPKRNANQSSKRINYLRELKVCACINEVAIEWQSEFNTVMQSVSTVCLNLSAVKARKKKIFLQWLQKFKLSMKCAVQKEKENKIE